MQKRKAREHDARSGQTLVETALVLPLICLTIAVVVQIVASCHNAVALQRIAYQAARALSAESGGVPANLAAGRLWGRESSPRKPRTNSASDGLKSFNAPSRVTQAGHISFLTMTSRLLPTGGFGRNLPALNQEATAEALVEPPSPKED